MRSPVLYAQTLKKIPSFFCQMFGQMWFREEFPRHLFIELTTRCNQSCGYCPREHRSEDMDFSTFQRAIRESSIYGPCSFSLHLFGEPLLYPKIVESVKCIKANNKKHTTLITTNGILLPKLYWQLEHYTDRFIVSYREGLEDIYRLPKDKITFRFFEEIEVPSWTRKFRIEKRPYHNYGGNYGGNLSMSNVPSAGNRWACYHLWFAPAVAWNGNILVCCADPKHTIVLGNLKENTIHEAWTSGKLSLLRYRHRRDIYNGICKKCDVWKSYPKIF